jgi:hypothetical protein
MLLNENAETLLASVAGVDCNSTGVVSLVTATPGKSMVITKVVIRKNSASLAGMDDLNFGGGSSANTPVWTDAATGMEALTTANMIWVITAAGLVTQPINGDESIGGRRTFGVDIVSASTGAATATFDVFGYEYDN